MHGGHPPHIDGVEFHTAELKLVVEAGDIRKPPTETIKGLSQTMRSDILLQRRRAFVGSRVADRSRR